MDITHRMQDIILAGTVKAPETQKALIRELVVDVLNEVIDNGHELGGMGEYGRGWNDAKEQTKRIVEEMIKRWKNDK
jgi:hypothetical protein